MTVEVGAVLFEIAFGIYVGATVCYALYLLSGKAVIGKTGTLLLLIGLTAHLASWVVRTAVLGRLPFLNLYEYLLSFTLGGVAAYLILEAITRNRAIGTFVVPFLTLFAYLTVRLPSEARPVLPALESAWRIPHIGTAILAYAAFALAFGLGIMYLIRQSAEKKGSFWLKRLPTPEVLDRSIYRSIAFGFMMQTAMIITGAIWAQVAWGRYWGWDPKETWALVTWLIYAAYLHTRTTMGWRGRRSAVLAIIGFVAVIITLLGVSFLSIMSGLHSYA